MKDVKKPWGNEKVFSLNKKSSVKILTVNANQQLSLQYHKKRREIWYFLDDAMVILGKKKRKIKKGEIVVIKKKMSHRIIAGKKFVRVLEISFGKFESKDIVRLEDKYGRK